MLQEIEHLRTEVSSLKMRLPGETAGISTHLVQSDRVGLSTPLATETAALERRAREVDQENVSLRSELGAALAENGGLRRTVSMLRRKHSSGQIPPVGAPETRVGATFGGDEASLTGRLMELHEDFE